MLDLGPRWLGLAPLLVLFAACGGPAQERAQQEEEDLPPVTPLHCTAGGLDFQDPPVADVRQAYSGSNGAFEDHCEDGNLVHYSCAVTYQQVNPMYPDTFPVRTGNVTESRLDCGGRCKAGVCPNQCPHDGDVIRFLSIAESGETVLLNVNSGWKYTCQYNGRSWVGYDCSTVLVGDELELILGPSGTCTHELGSLGLGSGIQSYCGYDDCVLTDP